MLLRASLACSVVALVGVLGGGCGGSIAPVGGGDGGGSGSSGGSSSSGGAVDSGVPGVDAAPAPDSAVALDAPIIGPCEPDGVPCSFDAQCCVNVCSAGVCGGTTPSCLGDGSSCGSSTECCSGQCTGGVCSEPTTVSCAVSSNANQCDVCLAESCCPQWSACESVPECAESQTCFDACYKGPGSGASCAQTCAAKYPSAQGATLEQCAATSCLTECD
jgi:hypothetical protein